MTATPNKVNYSIQRDGNFTSLRSVNEITGREGVLPRYNAFDIISLNNLYPPEEYREGNFIYNRGDKKLYIRTRDAMNNPIWVEVLSGAFPPPPPGSNLQQAYNSSGAISNQIDTSSLNVPVQIRATLTNSALQLKNPAGTGIIFDVQSDGTADNILIGNNANIGGGNNNITIGLSASTIGANNSQIVIGRASNTRSGNNVAIGDTANVFNVANGGIAIGRKTSVGVLGGVPDSAQSIAIGSGSDFTVGAFAQSVAAIAIGGGNNVSTGARAIGTGSLAICAGASANADKSISIGQASTASSPNSIAIGNSASVDAAVLNGIAIGNAATLAAADAGVRGLALAGQTVVAGAPAAATAALAVKINGVNYVIHLTAV